MENYKDPIILKSDAIKAAGNACKLANILGVSRQAVTLWGDIVPPLSAYRLLQIMPNIKKDGLASD